MTSKNQKILHVTTVHPSLDNRIHYKECLSLKEAGYDIGILGGVNEKIEIEGIQYYPLPKFKSRLARFFKGNICVVRQALKLQAKLVHFHDPELIPAALILKMNSLKVIYDVHEDLPEQLLYKQWIPKLVRTPLSFAVRFIEKVASLFFDKIVVATSDIAKKFNPKKVEVVRNLPVLGLIKEQASEKKKEESNKLVLIYAGGLTKVRGIHEIIEAVGLVSMDLELRLIGKWESEDYQKSCESLTAYSKVKYMGYMSMENVYNEIARADIGLALLYPIKNYLRSLPVKAFEYMIQSKPFIMSDFPFWKEEFTELALFANPMDVKEIAEAISKLANSSELRKQMGTRAKLKIEQELNWELESKKLLALYASVLK